MNFEVKGKPFPAVVCTLQSGESVKCQSGAMAWMSPNMEMQTKSGGIGKMFSKAISGESLFENIYTAQGGDGMIAFASGVPGDILPIQVSPEKTIVAQKKAFLASEVGVNYEVFFQKKIGAGLVGGEGFIMQKFSGNGYVFLEIDGSVVDYDLQAGEQLVVDTGTLAACDATCSIDVQTVKGLGNMFAGGEGFFVTKITGPGHVYLQTMPVPTLAGAIRPYIPSK